MNLLVASLLLNNRRPHKINIARLDDRLLNDIRLSRIDFHSGRAMKKTA